MINRIFKTILVLSIVLGVTLPSNAAVSVSDGSAFVTKAEFAADLNNLSNRMAQLENSLDAKIDSLVSSYLTRNGIWNGAKQVLKDNQSGRMGLHQQGAGLVSVRAQGYVGASVATENKYEVFRYADTTSTVIEKTNKAGMMVVGLRFDNYTTGLKSGTRAFDVLDDVTSAYPLYHYVIIDLNLGFYKMTGTNRSDVYSWSYSKSFNDSTSLAVESTKTVYAYFFVAKDDKIMMSSATRFYCQGSHLASWQQYNATWYWICNVLDSYIY